LPIDQAIFAYFIPPVFPSLDELSRHIVANHTFVPNTALLENRNVHFSLQKMDIARSLQELGHMVHGCQGHWKDPPKKGPSREALAWTSLHDAKNVSTWTRQGPFFKNVEKRQYIQT
jgi:hypothetical protein